MITKQFEKFKVYWSYFLISIAFWFIIAKFPFPALHFVYEGY